MLPIARNRARPQTSAEAWNAIRGRAERRAKLLGLDAPARRRVEVITSGMIDAAIAQLEAELSEA